MKNCPYHEEQKLSLNHVAQWHTDEKANYYWKLHSGTLEFCRRARAERIRLAYMADEIQKNKEGIEDTRTEVRNWDRNRENLPKGREVETFTLGDF